MYVLNILYLLMIVNRVVIASFLLESTPTIEIKSGKLRGTILHDEISGTYYSYLGIPYADVQDRFQAAKPVHWDDVFEANDDSVKCAQKTWLKAFLLQKRNKVLGQENCLTLNVHTLAPKDEDSKSPTLKPVMVFIHGGSFQDGSLSSHIYGPQYLIRHHIVLVVINYRVDVLGFLCLKIKEAPGNIGMKDQVEALKWVKENIKNFGGDPDNVTIFGAGSGSASVMFHLLSPMSKGLFHKIIMQSGSSISPSNFQFEPLKMASKLAKQMGHETEDPYELYKIFKNKTVYELLRIGVPRIEGDTVQSENIFIPCAEKEIPGVDAFITDNPYNLIAKGEYLKMPMIIGYNDGEGYLFASRENDTTIAEMDFFKSLPRDLKFSSVEVAKETAAKLKNLYMDVKNVSQTELELEVGRFEGDLGIIYPVTATANMMLKTNDKEIFVYRFEYDGLLNLMKKGSGLTSAPGATHNDEIFYLFKPMLTTVDGKLEMPMIDKMTVMWSDFAKYGNPTPTLDLKFNITWQPTNKNSPSLLVINEQFSTAPLWDSNRLEFWNQTYNLYRRKE